MKKNRRISTKMSVMAQRSVYIGSIIISLFLMVVLNFLAKSSCSQLSNSIGLKERELAKLQDECTRESARWEQMQTPERLEKALVRHNLPMLLAKASQNIRMRPDGKPYPNQISVAKASMRSPSVATASNNRAPVKRR
jgi:hypothetical protein